MLPHSSWIAAILLCYAAGWCAANDIQLSFPEDRDCGIVSIGPQPRVSRGWTDFFGERQYVGKARGILAVPRDAFVELDVNRIGGADLSFLNALPVDGIHSLKLSWAILGKAEFAVIARFTALRNLVLTDCRSSPKLDLSGAPAPAALQSLNVSMSDGEGHRVIPVWAARCPKLQYLYDRRGAFDVATLQQFKAHPSLSFLTVEFGPDATEVIGALKDIPNLRGLNVEVKTDDYLQALPQLATVELFNWGGGRIDAATLKKFGQLPSLKTLRFQGSAKLTADFADGFQFLDSVEELVLNANENECPPDKLQSALGSMKRLTAWPEIRLASRQTLQGMAARGNLKRIDIRGLGTDATAEDIARLCQTRTLESVSLRGIPFTSALGDELATCPNLSGLFLEVEDFDGNNLGGAERFANLRHLHINVEQSAINLSPLAQLPELLDLSLSVSSLQPLDYRFVGDSRSLLSFDTRCNVVTDASIQEIAKSTSVRSLHLGENCILSDAGLGHLAQCRQLTNLAVGGSFSIEAVQDLDRIPGLSRLSVSGQFSELERQELQSHFARLTSADFHAVHSSFGDHLFGDDGFWRENDPKWRSDLDALEGMDLRTLLGAALSDSLEKQLQGKVVLIDFWGTWCGPCLALMPDLSRFRKAYGQDQFEILGIHSIRGAETLDDYLQKNPKSWPNIADTTGELAKAFAVPHYPGLYLFDRQGKLRLAVPFRPGLESAIQKLLRER